MVYLVVLLAALCANGVRAVNVGDACSTSGTRGFPPQLCGDFLECVIFDEGRPAVDIPNRGICQMKPRGRLIVTEIASPVNVFGSASFVEISNVGDADINLREYALVKVERRRGIERTLRAPLYAASSSSSSSMTDGDNYDDDDRVRAGESIVICESKSAFDATFNGTAVCTVEAGPVANVFGDDMVLLTVHATPTDTSPAEVRASSLRSNDDVVDDASTRASLELVVDVYGGNVFMRPAQDGSRNTPVAISFLNWQTYWPPMLYGRAVRVRLPPPLPPPLLSMSSAFNVGSLVAIFNADDWNICSLFGDGGSVIDIDNAGSGSAARFMNVCPMRALVAPDDFDPSTWTAP